MHTRSHFLVGVVSVGVMLGAGASPAGANGQVPDQRAQWVSRYGGPSGNPDWAADVESGPDGKVVYVTGSGATEENDWSDYATLAYDAATGDQLWLSRYDGPAGADDGATAMAVSADGSRVFVTGRSDGAQFEIGWATIAYDASTGAQLWVTRLDNPSTFIVSGPSAIRATPDGKTVFMTGAGADPGGRPAWVTVAYDAATGRQRWVDYLVGTGFPSDLVLSPDGRVVYITSQAGPDIYFDIITMVLDAATGDRLAYSRYSSPGQSQDYAYAIGVSPDGSRVFVTGEGAAHYVTIGYDSSTLSQLWVSTYHGPGDTTDAAYALAVSPDGTQLSVTGYSAGLSGNSDYGTVTYDAATGAQLWVARYVGDLGSIAEDLAYRPDGARLFVTGSSWNDGTETDYVTVTYDAESGRQVVATRLDGPSHVDDTAVALAVSPRGTQVFVTGWIDDTGADYPPTDYGAVAYPAR